MPDPLNRNPASEKEVSKDVNKLARLPETLSDPEFAKLQFPKQDFMNNLGKEGLPNPPEPETFDPPPENLQSPNGLNETNDFKVNFRPNANERNFEHLPTESILLKKRDMNVNLSDAAVIFNSERLYGAVSSLVNTADGFIGKELTGVVFNSKMQNLEVSSGDKRYLISSRYEFEEIQSSPLEKVYRTELEKLEEESKELISTLDGMTTIEEYHERSQNWLTKVEEHSDRIDFSPFFGLNGSVRNYDQLSAEDKLIVKSLIEDKEKLNEVFEKFNLFKKKEREIKGLREKLESSKYYEGTLSDGTEVLASYDTESKKIDIFDLSNNRIAKEYVSYGSLIYQRNLPNNFIELRTTPSLNDEQGMTREIQDSDLRSQIVERYDVNGELSETSYVNLGYLDKYRDGAIVDRIVSNAQVVMQNFDKVMEVEGGENLIRASVAEFGIRSLESYAQVRSLSDSSELIETGFTNYDVEDLERLLQEADKYIASKNGFLSGKHNLNQVEINEFKKLVNFRVQMVRDGTELSRDNSFERENYNPGPFIWNDPTSRGYFEIKDSLIDWNSQDVKSLIDTNNPELSKKELKLLVARNLFDSAREINRENITSAIDELATLRKQYGAVDIIKDRNIVLAANNERSASGYGPEYRDPHSFGKPALSEAIRDRQGSGNSFEIFRDESEIINSRDAMERAFAKVVTDSTSREEIIRELQENSELRGGAILKKDVLDLLYEQGLDYIQASEVVKELEVPLAEKVKSMSRTKEGILEAISNTPRPFSFIFDGHGSPDAIYLSDGQLSTDFARDEVETTVKITPEEMADAIRNRFVNFGATSDPTGKDVFVFQNCFNSNFVRKVSEKLEGNEKPIFIGASEFNQVSYYGISNEYGSLFLSDVVLGVDRKTKEFKGESTINGVIERQYQELKQFENESSNLNTNPGVYVPNDQDVLIQISSLEVRNSTNSKRA